MDSLKLCDWKHLNIKKLEVVIPHINFSSVFPITALMCFAKALRALAIKLGALGKAKYQWTESRVLKSMVLGILFNYF